jgi:UDPglucose--hexose-1-phosphate uridylyltransferase
MTGTFFDQPHRRLNALTGEWIFVSPHRSKRPWQGRVEPAAPPSRPSHDAKCYLCPGNSRANQERNPDYSSTFIFENDFAAFLPGIPGSETRTHSLLQAHAQAGTSRVICFSPRHDLTLAQMGTREIRQVVDVWAEQTAELCKRWRWVQIFENKGDVMGCSNPHPHGQIWAGDFIPNEPAKELVQQRWWFNEHLRPLLLDYADLELKEGERIVVQNQHWLAVVPWWAVWPFETLILPRRHVLRLPELTDVERDSLADLMRRLLTRYDNLFETSFPYSMGWHGAPGGADDYQGWQLHAYIYPPLLRSATVKKFMVGYEMLAEAQRDITPESAAARLRALNEEHYLVNRLELDNQQSSGSCCQYTVVGV